MAAVLQFPDKSDGNLKKWTWHCFYECDKYDIHLSDSVAYNYTVVLVTGNHL